MEGMDQYARQNYDLYTTDDHQTWSELVTKQGKLNRNLLASEYVDGLQKLSLSKSKIAEINTTSSILERYTGWKLVAVKGLIPTKEFFYLLIDRKYPITVSIRQPYEIDFSEQPDIFHDIYGHLPLLTSARFSEFLKKYSEIALKYIHNDDAIEYLGKFYWYTYEMGVIKSVDGYRPYGGAIVTSAEEVRNLFRQDIPKHRFDIDHIFDTPFNPYRLQNEYFVIDSFDELFCSLNSLELKIIERSNKKSDKKYALKDFGINPYLEKDNNNVISFLNSIKADYPSAISFAAGQPDERFFNLETNINRLNTYIDFLYNKTGIQKDAILNSIGQYGGSKGIINDILAAYLLKDEGIKVAKEDLIVTVGAQEAFSIIVTTICNKGEDVILMEDPGYVGMKSFAQMYGYQVEGVSMNEEGIVLSALESKILDINRKGKKIKLVYVVPDFQNPTGALMPLENRISLLELANRYNFLIVEDSVYNGFNYLEDRLPTLKSLDNLNRVIYVGSFSKSIFPGLRLGIIAANQFILKNEIPVRLIDKMAKVKANMTNNTPTINQAILGGILLYFGYSLREYCVPKLEEYSKKLTLLLDALDKYIRPLPLKGHKKISWTKPKGGFFLKMTMPFPVDFKEVAYAAERFNVIFCPMSSFYFDNQESFDIRLAFTNLSKEEIEEGVQRLSKYILDKLLCN